MGLIDGHRYAFRRSAWDGAVIPPSTVIGTQVGQLYNMWFISADNRFQVDCGPVNVDNYGQLSGVWSARFIDGATRLYWPSTPVQGQRNSNGTYTLRFSGVDGVNGTNISTDLGVILELIVNLSVTPTVGILQNVALIGTPSYHISGTITATDTIPGPVVPGSAYKGSLTGFSTLPSGSTSHELAWIIYLDGIYYYIGPDAIVRVVTCFDVTAADMAAQDWTLLTVDCVTAADTTGECGCAIDHTVFPSYPAFSTTVPPAFDPKAPNAQFGLFGCDTPGGPCACGTTGTSSDVPPVVTDSRTPPVLTVSVAVVDTDCIPPDTTAARQMRLTASLAADPSGNAPWWISVRSGLSILLLTNITSGGSTITPTFNLTGAPGETVRVAIQILLPGTGLSSINYTDVTMPSSCDVGDFLLMGGGHMLLMGGGNLTLHS